MPTPAPSESPTPLPSESPTPLPSQSPTRVQCFDGVQNEDETDVDCGGSCSSCALGQGCLLDTDCSNRSCSSGICISAAPTVVPTATPTLVPTFLACEIGHFYNTSILDCQPCSPGTSKNLKVRLHKTAQVAPPFLILHLCINQSQGHQLCEPCPVGYSQPLPV